MPELNTRIDLIEQKLSTHSNSIEKLEDAIEKHEKQYNEIIEKLNMLVYRDQQSKDTFEHHKLLCQAGFDNRYVLKSSLKADVIEMITENYKKKLDNTKSINYIISNIMDIAWKVIVICGGIYGILNLLGA